MTYTVESECTGSITIGVYDIYVNRLRDLSHTLYIYASYASSTRTYVKVGLQHVWRPMEGDDVV